LDCCCSRCHDAGNSYGLLSLALGISHQVVIRGHGFAVSVRKIDSLAAALTDSTVEEEIVNFSSHQGSK
jgi:hypothetical protein